MKTSADMFKKVNQFSIFKPLHKGHKGPVLPTAPYHIRVKESSAYDPTKAYKFQFPMLAGRNLFLFNLIDQLKDHHIVKRLIKEGDTAGM